MVTSRLHLIVFLIVTLLSGCGGGHVAVLLAESPLVLLNDPVSDSWHLAQLGSDPGPALWYGEDWQPVQVVTAAAGLEALGVVYDYPVIGVVSQAERSELLWQFEDAQLSLGPGEQFERSTYYRDADLLVATSSTGGCRGWVHGEQVFVRDEVSSCQVSDDGAVVVVWESAQAEVLDFLGQSQFVVPSFGEPMLESSGEMIVASSVTVDGWIISVHDANTGESIFVTEAVEEARVLDISTNGKVLVRSGSSEHGDLRVIDMQSGEETIVAIDAVQSAAFADDAGTTVAVEIIADGEVALGFVDMSTGQVEMFIEGAASGSVYVPDPGSNEQETTVFRLRDKSDNLGILVVDATGVRFQSEGTGLVSSGAWLSKRSGEVLVHLQYQDSAEFWVVPLVGPPVGGALRAVTISGVRDISATHALVDVRADGDFQRLLLALDNPIEILNLEVTGYFSQFGVDGRSILFSRGGESPGIYEARIGSEGIEDPVLIQPGYRLRSLLATDDTMVPFAAALSDTEF